MRNAQMARPGAFILLLLASSSLALQSPDLGAAGLFPPDNYWHWDVSKLDVHPNSANYVASIGTNTNLHPDFGTVYEGAPWGIPYIVVDKTQPKIPINFLDYGDESDPGPYPIPLNAPIEGGNPNAGDRHVLCVDKDAHMLYELGIGQPQADHWDASCGATWNLNTNAMRPDTWTSADAAGLPILAGLVRYDEVARGVINHAIRMTVQVSQKKYFWPAQHYASKDTSHNRPPMGLRFRLKAGYDTAGYPPSAKVILVALKKYGFIVADNGGDWYFSGAPDDRWNDGEINTLKKLKGGDFEAVLSVDANNKPIYPPGMAVLPIMPMRQQIENGPMFNLLGRLLPVGGPAASMPVIQSGSLISRPR